MAEKNSSPSAMPKPVPENEDGPWPCMVTLFRSDKELVAVGASDAEDAARQVAILVLKQAGGLRIGDAIQISRI